MNDNLNDNELLVLFRAPATKEKAFNLLIKKYQQKLYWQIRRYVEDHSDADDVLQEVFIKVWKNLDSFREDAQVYTWLFRISYNECMNFLKKNKMSIQVDIEDHLNSLPSNANSVNELSGMQIERKLLDAIDTLPEKQKLVFHLKYFDEIKYEEMSTQLGTSVGALKASYHLAVKKIEEYLTKD